MELIKKIKKINLLFLLKTGVGSAIAILIADRLGLVYSASAGIITLLTIQNTKKETIIIALKRIVAFLVAVIIAYTMFGVFGYTSIAFGGFVFVFVAVCNIFGLQDGISMNAVLTTHFLIEQNMNISFLINEISILVIGMSIGITLNLIMPRNKDKLEKEQKILEEHIRSTLREMSNIIKGQEVYIDFNKLDKRLENLLKKAYEDAGNRFLSDTKYLISYLEMRKTQVSVLKNIQDDINKINKILPQSHLVAEYMEKVGDCFHELNDVKKLLTELESLYEYFRNEKLPVSREEFENRAILFSILKDMEYFLEVKRNFILE